MTPAFNRRIAAAVAAVLLPPALTLLFTTFRATVAPPVVALVLVLVVTACAVYGGVVAGVIAAATSSLAFDYWFSPPIQRFTIAGRNDIETTVLLFVIGGAAAALAVTARRSDALAARRAGYLAMLHDFAEMVATGESPDFVVIRAAAELTRLLELLDCQFEATASDPRIPRLEPGGDVFVSGVLWNVGELGMPGKTVELLVESHGQSRGRFILMPTPGASISIDRRVVAVALADQVGAALSGRLRGDGPPSI